MTDQGPSWIGIGAQRCGTTWFVDLLTQHPLVDVPDGKKEHDELYRFGLMAPWDKKAAKNYKDKFSDSKIHFGEFSPAYMRALWVPELALEVLPSDAPIFVLLRDPLDRFASGLRHMMQHAIRRHQKRMEQQEMKAAGYDEERDPPLVPLPARGVRGGGIQRERKQWLKRVAAASATRYVLGPPDGKGLQDRTWLRYVGGDAIYCGMYGAQLDAWTQAIPKERFLVIQYEKMRKDPQHYMNLAWERLGLEPVELKNIGQRSTSSTRPELWVLEDHPHIVRMLKPAYRPDAERVASQWDIDISLWKRLMADD